MCLGVRGEGGEGGGGGGNLCGSMEAAAKGDWYGRGVGLCGGENAPNFIVLLLPASAPHLPTSLVKSYSLVLSAKDTHQVL